MKIAREGYPFIIAASLGALITFAVGWLWVPTICIFFVLAIGYFFRDPERDGPNEGGVILSPADGKVVGIKEELSPEGSTQPGQIRISIFLSILDVHVNRSPVQGRVETIHYQPGKFLAAFREEASQINEQNAVRMTSRTGGEVEIVQIAGLLARRIICYVKEGQELARGQRLGIIMFGSRVDVSLPKGSSVTVVKGQMVQGGLTVIGRLS